MFRITEDKAVINRFGFNSSGHPSMLTNLLKRIQKSTLTPSPPQTKTQNSTNYKSLYTGKLLGINLGKNKKSCPNSNSDYIKGVQEFYNYADYIVVNISSPNTPGLRALQEKERIKGLLFDVLKERDSIYLAQSESKSNQQLYDMNSKLKVPVVVKIAPDLSSQEIKDIANVCMEVGIDGVIIGNSSIGRKGLKDTSIAHETGGLSGKNIM